MIRVFIGYDPKETVAAHVLTHSIQRYASEPVSITWLSLPQLTSAYWRVRDSKQSTDFTYTRFLVPFLCGFEGRAIFMDCDFLCRGDIAELWKITNNGYAVNVVKHDYTPKTTTKFLDQPQTTYPKKNWSSMIVFNNRLCRSLRPADISEHSGMYLHQFLWLDNEELNVGSVGAEWNHLVGEYDYNPDAKLVHFTLGGPYFKDYQECDYADEWFDEFESMCFCQDRSSLLE